MKHISFTNFDDLKLAHETEQQIELSRFGAMFVEIENSDDEEYARAPFMGSDGNIYAIVESVGSDKYFFIGLMIGSDGMCDFVAFSEHDSYMQALNEMCIMSDTDLNG